MWPTLLFGLRNPASHRPHAQSHTRRRTPLRRAPGRLLVEQFEDRTVPSYLVTTPLDVVDPNDGVLSLREAVQAANATPGADVIRFAPRVHGTIALGELRVTDALTIDGPGAGRLAVSGNDATRVFDISPGSTVAIEGLTIAHGLAVNGGGILNDGGILTLSQDVISDNEALGAPGASGQTASGSGIANLNGTTLTIKFSR